MNIRLLNAFVAQKFICNIIPYMNDSNVEFHIAITYQNFSNFVNKNKIKLLKISFIDKRKQNFSHEIFELQTRNVTSDFNKKKNDIKDSLVVIYSTDEKYKDYSILFNNVLPLNNKTVLNTISDFFIIKSILSINKNRLTEGIFNYYHEIITTDFEIKSKIKKEILNINVIQIYINKVKNKTNQFEIEVIEKYNQYFDELVSILLFKK